MFTKITSKIGKGLLASSVAAACALAATSTTAATIQTQTIQGGYTANQYGGSSWTTFTGMMDAAHSVSTSASFDTIGAVDALWVDQELYGALSGTEISSITSFVSGGKKAVIIGENSSWASWNDSVMSITGGSYTSECNFTTGTATSAHSLTAGVNEVQNVCGSTVTSGGAADILFSNGLAALYQVGGGEVLVILDSNWNDNNYITGYQNQVFAQNVVDWLGDPVATTPVPLPAGLPLMLSGMALFGLMRRRG